MMGWRAGGDPGHAGAGARKWVLKPANRRVRLPFEFRAVFQFHFKRLNLKIENETLSTSKNYGKFQGDRLAQGEQLSSLVKLPNWYRY
jgi:hypothetical protein